MAVRGQLGGRRRCPGRRLDRVRRLGAGLPGPGRGGRRPHLLRVCTTAGYPARCCVRGSPGSVASSATYPLARHSLSCRAMSPMADCSPPSFSTLTTPPSWWRRATPVRARRCGVRPDGFQQLDTDLRRFVRPLAFHPEVVGGMPERRGGEANMDLQVIHAIAQDAKLVLTTRGTPSPTRATVYS